MYTDFFLGCPLASLVGSSKSSKNVSAFPRVALKSNFLSLALSSTSIVPAMCEMFTPPSASIKGTFSLYLAASLIEK